MSKIDQDMVDEISACRYAFIDESGNLDFSENGTSFFLLTCVRMTRPFLLADELDAFRHRRLEEGVNQVSFHCAKEGRSARGKVFELIARNLDEIKIDCLVLEKKHIDAHLSTPEKAYPWMLQNLMRTIMPYEDTEDESRTVIITDTVPVSRGKRKSVIRKIRRGLAEFQSQTTKFHIYHHLSSSHYGLQIADYCSWAIFRKWEMGDTAWYNRIKPSIAKETVILRVAHLAGG